MKKVFLMMMAVMLLFSFAGCSNQETPVAEPTPVQTNEPSSTPAEDAGTPDENQTDTAKNALVVYFSWSGNTESVAQAIQAQTDADIFEIVPQQPYSDDYDAVVDLAQQEQQEDARPAIADSIENIAQYDVIYVGFPNWWGDMPMILYTFFDSYDLSGKTIAPFCTSGGGGLSNTVSAIKSLEPDATVTDGLHIGSASASNPDNAVGEWLRKIGLLQ